MGLDSISSNYEENSVPEEKDSYPNKKRPSRREWRQMNDDEILNYVWNAYGKDITPTKLKDADTIIYQRLLNRDLTSRLKSGIKTT